jgi:GcrA cell cycle regulator
MGVIKWTDEDKALLRQLWVEEGLAASTIAARLSRELQRPISRNAVIGVAHRAGLALGGVERVRRMSANKGNGMRRKKRKLTPPAQKPQSPLAKILAEPWVPRAEPIIPERERVKSVRDLEDHHCRAPLGKGPAWQFCGRQRVPGVSYCEGHARIFHNAAQPARAHAHIPAPGPITLTVWSALVKEDA